MAQNSRKTFTRQRKERSRNERRRCLPESIKKRNQAVLDHLGLAHLAASRQAAKGAGEIDDLIQEASLGLIMAMEKFDPSLGFKVSSYGMARAKGQILHFRRDRLQMIRVPWRLRDLYARGMRLQQEELQRNSNQLDRKQLAAKLNVKEERWQKAVEAQWQTRIVSLDIQESSARETNNKSLIPQLEKLISPNQNEADQQLIWLKSAIRQLNADQQRWLNAHYLNGISVRKLAQCEQIHEAVLRRKLRMVLKQLQRWAHSSPEEIFSL
ncbi:MAG TPA: sigma-70 family RNA polymerase sigma factor [Prochlorococcus sp.]|nr:sigma-70 family RNA polymerase sigma factor [Prochlorococcaceae cyanobacterium ETNP2_MAG_10]